MGSLRKICFSWSLSDIPSLSASLLVWKHWTHFKQSTDQVSYSFSSGASVLHSLVCGAAHTVRTQEYCDPTAQVSVSASGISGGPTMLLPSAQGGRWQWGSPCFRLHHCFKTHDSHVSHYHRMKTWMGVRCSLASTRKAWSPFCSPYAAGHSPLRMLDRQQWMLSLL